MKIGDDKVEVAKLPPLSGEIEGSYLIQLHYQKPNTIFGWPLYAFRTFGGAIVKVYDSEIESITWKKEKNGFWTVTFKDGRKFKSLVDVKNFIYLKNKVSN